MTAGNGFYWCSSSSVSCGPPGHARGGNWDAVTMLGLGFTLITGIVLAHGLYESRRREATEQLSSE